jgi:bacterioferritin-associated ferredoxin
MQLNEYQKEIAKISKKEITTVGRLLYDTLDLSSNCGKFVEKIKNIIEEKDGKIHPDDKSELVKSLGDALATISQIADDLYITLDDVVSINLQSNVTQLKNDIIQ